MSESATQFQRWNAIYAGPKYFYGYDAGPVARRAVRYHRPHCPAGGRAIDLGCGEGQDLAFLAEAGYEATGLELTPNGVEKSRRLLEERGLTDQAQVVQTDLLSFDWKAQYDLVLAVNCLQFLGTEAPAMLDRAIELVAPGGILGLSVFAREDESASAVRGGVWFGTRREVMARLDNRIWQPLEATDLYQWSRAGESPQAFVTLIARRLK